MSIIIKRRDVNETVDSMLKRYKKAVEEEGLIQEIRKREYYVPKSEAKRIKKKQAQRRRMIEERKKKRFYD